MITRGHGRGGCVACRKEIRYVADRFTDTDAAYRCPVRRITCLQIIEQIIETEWTTDSSPH